MTGQTEGDAMRVSTYTNRKDQERVGIALTLAEAAAYLAEHLPEARISVQLTPEQASALVPKVQGSDLHVALREAGIVSARSAPKATAKPARTYAKAAADAKRDSVRIHDRGDEAIAQAQADAKRTTARKSSKRA